MMMSPDLEVPSYVQGEWRRPEAREHRDVTNPATGEVLGRVPLCAEEEVGRAAAAAARAFPGWRRTPVGERIQYLFRLKGVLEQHREEIARTVTLENGKTLAEARGELRRGIENVEAACAVPILLQGYNLDEVARGIDEVMTREPLGVVAAITPFNFPVMIPLWFLPQAIACGNTFILKPSERTPLTMRLVFELMGEIGLPPGVVNLVHGSREAVNAIVDHPEVRAISLVGSTPVAREVYARSAARGKRAQCQGGAKNYVVVMPDADLEPAARVIGESAFGCAGQRCLAASVVLTVGEMDRAFAEAIAAEASALRVGNGLEEGTQMGPVISPESKARVKECINRGAADGALLLVDGRSRTGSGLERGNFLGPTVLDRLPAESPLVETEIFGPVLSLIPARDLEEALGILSRSSFGNAASIFTTSGKAAREFRSRVPAGNVGVNIAVAAPMAYFPFAGLKNSFFGVLHGQGRDAVEFYTEKKVVIERW
jgi:malonate-semialdehyde dehydrogenase (acetylating)/methylmalonate-semialdehyde dehydrogenase